MFVGCGIKCAQEQVLANVVLMFANRLWPVGGSVMVSGPIPNRLAANRRISPSFSNGDSPGKPPQNVHEGNLLGESRLVAPAAASSDFAQVGLEEAGVSDQVRAGNAGIRSGRGSVQGIRAF